MWLRITLPTTTTTPTKSPWKGDVPRIYDLTCDDTVCPPNSFCLGDHDTGGSRCHCNLGRTGDTCSEGEIRVDRCLPGSALKCQLCDHKCTVVLSLYSPVMAVKFPRFYGYSHMTFEPLKNSYQSFQITLEIKVKQNTAFTVIHRIQVVFYTTWY